MGKQTPCLGGRGSLNKTLVTHTCNLGTSHDQVPIRQQPCEFPLGVYMDIRTLKLASRGGGGGGEGG